MKIEAKAEKAFGKATLWASYEATGQVTGIEFLSDAARDEFVRLINAGQAALEIQESLGKKGTPIGTWGPCVTEQDLDNMESDKWEQRRWELVTRRFECADIEDAKDRAKFSIKSADILIAEFRKGEK